MDKAPIIVWLRQDLRLSDNPALWAAVERGAPVLPVHVLDDGQPWSPGAAARWWRHHSLSRFGRALEERGGRLVLLKGRAVDEIVRLAAATGARAVLWNRHWQPQERAAEAELAHALAAAGVEPGDFPANLLVEPGSVRNQQGEPYQVFSAFWRAALTLLKVDQPLPAPRSVPAPAGSFGLPIEALGLMPTIPWWTGMAEAWTPGEEGAAARLAAFLGPNGLDLYAAMRDRPDQPGTSRLSPHLAHGEISVRQIWHAVAGRPQSPGAETFLKELGWREFSYQLLAANPTLPDRPLRSEFERFPWSPDDSVFEAWKRGRTGFPMVDAGMRQLWATGWMHNRVRMIVASFLVKDLLLPWQKGEEWFHDTLVDADLAANAASWQWVAGCGADAAPYFRVFNPVLQGEKFDPRGRYVRQWLPELAGLPDLYIHRPAEAPPMALKAAGVQLGKTYPHPIVDHGTARRRALSAYNSLKQGSG